MDNITPHMYSAGALVLIAIICCYQGIVMFAEPVEITNKDLHLSPQESTLELVTSKQVLNALSEDPKRMVQNPFLEPLKREGTEAVNLVDVKVPKPPVPPLNLPMPPVLPLPGEK